MEENNNAIQETIIKDNKLETTEQKNETVEKDITTKKVNTKKKSKKEIEYITEKCKIIQSYKDTIVINFHDKCISFDIENNTYKKDDMIEVMYKGTIGKKNFEIKLK